MLKWIIKMNDRYDDLDETHPDTRFLIFMVPMCAAVLICHLAPKPFNLMGLIAMMAMTAFRLIPIFFRRKV